MSEREERHTIAVLVDNEPGVLARVIGLFSGRGYNIDSLTVAEVDHARGLSRINIVTSGTAPVIEQIKALLDKLVPVHKVSDLTIEGAHVERELALIKVAGDREQRVQALRIADFMHARLVDSAKESFVFEITGASPEIDAFIGLMEPLASRGRDRPRRQGVVKSAARRSPARLAPAMTSAHHDAQSRWRLADGQSETAPLDRRRLSRLRG